MPHVGLLGVGAEVHARLVHVREVHLGRQVARVRRRAQAADRFLLVLRDHPPAEEKQRRRVRRLRTAQPGRRVVGAKASLQIARRASSGAEGLRRGEERVDLAGLLERLDVQRVQRALGVAGVAALRFRVRHALAILADRGPRPSCFQFRGRSFVRVDASARKPGERAARGRRPRTPGHPARSSSRRIVDSTSARGPLTAADAPALAR